MCRRDLEMQTPARTVLIRESRATLLQLFRKLQTNSKKTTDSLSQAVNTGSCTLEILVIFEVNCTTEQFHLQINLTFAGVVWTLGCLVV